MSNGVAIEPIWDRYLGSDQPRDPPPPGPRGENRRDGVTEPAALGESRVLDGVTLPAATAPVTPSESSGNAWGSRAVTPSRQKTGGAGKGAPPRDEAPSAYRLVEGVLRARASITAAGIASVTGLAPDAVQTALGELEEDGVVERQQLNDGTLLWCYRPVATGVSP